MAKRSSFEDSYKRAVAAAKAARRAGREPKLTARVYPAGSLILEDGEPIAIEVKDSVYPDEAKEAIATAYGTPLEMDLEPEAIAVDKPNRTVTYRVWLNELHRKPAACPHGGCTKSRGHRGGH